VVHEKDHSIHGAVDLEVSLEESGSLKVDSHGSENDGEVLLVVVVDILTLYKRGLSADLGSDFVVRETGS
jgi:hypothetical protein